MLYLEEYWIFLRLGGIFLTILFMAEGILLWKRYKQKMAERVQEFLENLKLYSQENGILENACPSQDYISEFNSTVIRTDEEVYVLWCLIKVFYFVFIFFMQGNHWI